MVWVSRVPVGPLRLISHHLASSVSPCESVRFASTATATLTPADKRKAYSHTLRLPKTSFPLKHKDVVAAEKKYRLKTCDVLYKEQYEKNDGSVFVLHDGPPYANGHLHMGHALNKVLKDIINRYKVITGHRVHYVPGWDCHGLPIEQKALAAIGKKHTSLTPGQVRAEAKKVALEAIDIQKTEMRALGVMADWEGDKGTYRTLDHDFEIRQLRLFQTMVEEGYVTHRLRPTYYSPSSRTALAEAELSYKDGHKSRSVYVAFPVEESDMSDGLRRTYREACEEGSKPLSLAIWTTTPWSLPGNSGVSVHNEMEYVVVSTEEGRLLVIAKDRLESMQEVLGHLEVLGSLDGSELVGTRYTHRFHPPSSSQPRPLVFASGHVTSAAGTGLVHSAPAHGQEDYAAFLSAGILPDRLRCPIDDDGRFTEELVRWGEDESLSSLVGKEVLNEGTDEMVEQLRAEGSLLAEETIEHRYPYDWKSKKPIILRATPQWFADVEAVKQDAVSALESVNFHPPQSRKRLEAFVMSRSEWCISRQRSWGVPIPALFDPSGQPVMDSETLSHIIDVLERNGVDHWWNGPVEDFIPPSHQGQNLSRGFDTLDVWFDSGSSWTLLKEANLRPLSKPLADVYLEGSDQHRGWFQSSLLTKLISSRDDHRAPYGTVITHGFVMDEDGEKMSKSAGNGLSPMEIIHGLNKDSPAYGADILRLWAASVDYTNDASIGPSSISHASEAIRKLRNTTRFLLANTAGSESKSLQEYDLRPIDRYILHELSTLEAFAKDAYEAYAFNKVLHATSTFASSTLSALYFDVIKDTLYCDSADNATRQAVIAVLQHTLTRLTQIIAPITPHLAEELYEHSAAGRKSSVFLETWQPDDTWLDHTVKAKVSALLAIRGRVQRLSEDARAAESLKTLNQADLYIQAQSVGLQESEILTESAMTLSGLFGVSEVELKAPPAQTAESTWRYTADLVIDLDGEATSGPIILTLLPASNHQPSL
nr:isoleucine-tRNA ligase [Kwoniella shandongensis]KAA5531483.1 isoleucine-tRNA ligase [Kwoniella shandongensis]